MVDGLLGLDLNRRRLILDPSTDPTQRQHRPAPPRTQFPGLYITDWDGQYAPKLNGKGLDLELFEQSWSLDIAGDGGRFLLGTSWYLRLYDRSGRLIWKTPAPAPTWMIKLSGDGRWAVVAFGVAKGKERLALFVEGAAIAAADRGGKSVPPPWVLWTPEGFFDSAGGSERLIGWHLNRGADRTGELIDAGQLGELFRRPDLIAQTLAPAYPKLARTALAESGDLEWLLAGTRAPRLERLGSARIRQTGGDFRARFRVEDRGGGVDRVEYRVDGVLIAQGDLRGYFGPGLPRRREENRPFALESGTYRIEARAFDRTDRLASPWVTWEVRVTGKSRRRPDLYGLAVGIGPYQDHSLSLEHGDEDARAFATTLATAARGLFGKREIRSLVNEQASRAGIETAFRSLAERTGPEDVFGVYWQNGMATYPKSRCVRAGSVGCGERLPTPPQGRLSVPVPQTGHSTQGIGREPHQSGGQRRTAGGYPRFAGLDQRSAPEFPKGSAMQLARELSRWLSHSPGSNTVRSHPRIRSLLISAQRPPPPVRRSLIF